MWPSTDLVQCRQNDLRSARKFKVCGTSKSSGLYGTFRSKNMMGDEVPLKGKIAPGPTGQKRRRRSKQNAKNARSKKNGDQVT